MSTRADYRPRHARVLSQAQTLVRQWGPATVVTAFAVLGLGVLDQAGHVAAAGYAATGAGLTAARVTRPTYLARHSRRYVARHSLGTR